MLKKEIPRCREINVFIDKLFKTVKIALNNPRVSRILTPYLPAK
jgi:phage FluMu protein Com